MILKYSIISLLVVFLVLPAFASDAKSPQKGWRNPKDGMEFVWIPAGSFLVHSASEPADAKLPPSECVTFAKGFWMGKTEVTVKQFRRFVQENGYKTDAEKAANPFTWKTPGFKQKDNYPVVWISFADALQYTQWAGVDLPYESEWLYACSAGTTTTFYWGDKLNGRYLWHRENAIDSTHPVAHKLPNAWGLYDIVGNAWEYCKICETSHIELGGSWTRCPQYLTRQGFIYEPFPSTVEPRIHKCEPPLAYPWDDDRGFRCIQREIPK